MIFGMRFGDPFGNVRSTTYAQVDPFNENGRILSWVPERSSGVLYHIILDGVKRYVIDEGVFQQTLKMNELNPRAVIEVIETSLQNFDEGLLNVMALPDDRVSLTWTPATGAASYKVYRKLGAGAYGDVIFEADEGASSYSFTDGPLEDGTYTYKLEALDLQGNSSFDEEVAVIASAPGRPSNLIGSWNAATHVFTLSWTASPSSDLDHYAIRHNGGSGAIRLEDAAEDTEATTSWSIDLTGLTGDYEFLVRAVDAGDVEEQNLSQLIRISVVVGVTEGIPAVPEAVQVVPIAGGKLKLTFAYFPKFEEGYLPIGVAVEARIYSDGGTGTMDWVNEVDTIAMGNPTESETFEWESGVLADDTYLYAVRVATDVSPAGTVTQNDDTYEVTTDGTPPGAIDLEVEVF